MTNSLMSKAKVMVPVKTPMPTVKIIQELIPIAIIPFRVPKSIETMMLKVDSIRIPLAAKPKENNEEVPNKANVPISTEVRNVKDRCLIKMTAPKNNRYSMI